MIRHASWMNNKTIIEFSFRTMWKIMQILEDVIQPYPASRGPSTFLDKSSRLI